MANEETLKLFDELYHETYQDILKYVICNCKNIEDVKDIVQNIYLNLLKQLNKGKENIDKKYLFGIAKHKINDYYRFKYRIRITSLFRDKENMDLIDAIPNEIDIEKDAMTEEDLKIIWEFLKKKNVLIPKIFYLYYYLDYNIKEIANILDITESNVKNYLYRTLKKLNELLMNGGEGNE